MNKMMKIALNKPVTDEKGQALILAMILMLVGGLIIAPLLGFMGTGLIAGQVFEKKMAGLYAADAGVEDAIWKLINDPPASYPYPYPDPLTVNGMSVSVVIEDSGPGAEGTLYTITSTAQLEGVTKAEIIAQVEVVFGGAVGAGGEGGDYGTNEETVAVSLISEDSIIFTAQNRFRFQGREDASWSDWIEPEDLALLNMATGTGSLYLDGSALGLLANPKYEFFSVHYYQDNGNDYLLMAIQSTAFVGANEFTRNDIIQLQVTIDYDTDPYHPVVTSATNDPGPLHTIPGANIAALTRLDDGTIFFSFSNPSATLGDNPFYRGEVIKLDLSDPENPVYETYFDAKYILPGNPNLELDCLAMLPGDERGRLLLSFTDDSGVTGSNGVVIEAEDLAIWDMGPDLIPNTSDDTINLHISMTIESTVLGAVGSVSIVSWEIS